MSGFEDLPAAMTAMCSDRIKKQMYSQFRFNIISLHLYDVGCLHKFRYVTVELLTL